MTGTRSWRANLAAILFGCVLALVAGELVLRWFWPQRSAVTLGMFRADPDAGYSLLPEYRNVVRVPEFTTVVRIDGEGYRVADESKPVPEGVRRILAIGDSFTFGVGVDAEATYAAQLESILQESGAAPVAVRNGGVGGYGPLRSERRFRAAQSAWKPEVVIHGIYLGNDLEDSRPHDFLAFPSIENGRMTRPGHHPLARIRTALRVHSHLYCFLRERLYGIYRATPLAARSQRLDPIGLSEWPASIVEGSWPAGQEAMSNLADWARENDALYVVVLIPIKYQIVDSAWDAYRRRWKLPDKAFDRERPQHVVREFLDGQGIAYVDLLPPFRASSEDLYYRVDNHWTAAGHAAAARILAEKLRELGWLPPAHSAADVARAAQRASNF